LIKTTLRINYVSKGEGADGAMAKASGRSAPAQGSNPGCCTLMLQGLGSVMDWALGHSSS